MVLQNVNNHIKKDLIDSKKEEMSILSSKEWW
jgi:hypothetical protein